MLGNLYDAVSLAAKAALHNTRIPKVTGKFIDGANVDLELSDDLFECWRLDVSSAPCLVTLCKVSSIDLNSLFIWGKVVQFCALNLDRRISDC